MWFIYAIISFCCWGLADLFYKKSSDANDKQSHLKIAVWVGLVMGVCALILLPFAESGRSLLHISDLIKYAPASLSYIISMVIGYAGMRYLELSVASPVQNASGALSAIFMAIWFACTSDNFLASISDETGFTFGHVQGLALWNNMIIVCGMLLIFIGVIALAVVEQRLSNAEQTLPMEERKYKLGALALLFPILYCLFDTIGTAADGIILDENTGLGLGEIDVIILYGLTFLLFGLCAWIYLWIRNKKPYNPFARKEIANKGVAACCEEAGQIVYVYAMAAKPMLAAPIIASYCILSVLLSRIFLKEKLVKKQYVTVFMVILGIVLLGISEGIGEM